MSEPTKWETIVKAGVEGGGLTVSGRQRPDGRWELRLSTNSMTLDNNDDETWVESTREVHSLAEAFECTAEYFGALVPRGPVHPEFRTEMLNLVEQLAPQPGAFAHESWESRNHRRWMQACSPSGSGDSEW
jgi:hypothetical protein